MEMGDQYGLPDLRRFLTRRTHFPASLPQPSEPYLAHRNMAPFAPYHEAFMLSNGMSSMPSGFGRFSLDHFVGASATTTATTAIAASASAGSGSSPCAALFGADMETGGGWSLGNIDGGGYNSRWPRQETLTLLEIRSRLDSKFKEANQKGPLWDEVSRLMAEEHGYQRSGKKCREKFENLYKYYKKTKEGKAGRQDGKNYRFFRQLEAIYGETSNHSSASETNVARRNLVSQAPNNAVSRENQESLLQEQKLSESLSLSNASEFETSSSENNNNDDDELSAIAFMVKQSMEENQKMSGSSSRVKKGWKKKVKDFVDSQMKKLIDSQDVWMERMLKTIEDKEQERMSKDEQWRRQEAARFDKEHEFWARERAWIEARDAALMEVLKKFAGKGLEASEHEISSLIQLGTSLERRLHETGYSKQTMWEEIEAKMVSLGYEHESNPECYKKRKEDFRSINYFQQLDAINDAQENNTNYSVKQRVELQQAAMDSLSSPSNSYDMNSFQIGEVNPGDQRLWDRYGLNLKLSKGKNQQF